MVPLRRLSSLLLLIASACAGALAISSEQSERLDRDFQTAVAQYNSGRLADAAIRLEALLQDVPESFEVHELLGLVYSAQSQDLKATTHFEKAVKLRPNSAAARTNYAANLARRGRLDLAEKEFRSAVELDSENFDANHDLGELYVRSGKISQAEPFLQQAHRVNPSSYDNGYNLALVYVQMGRLSDARDLVNDLLTRKNTSELHNLLGVVEEKDEKFVAAANEFETAAHLDPSESNLFDWGSELLLHRTLDPAIEVFRQAAQRYPGSPRVAIGLGVALYSRGNYDDAVKSLLRAADLNPSDPDCYRFLSRAYDSSPSQAEEVIRRFRRFAELQSKNPAALYYYAMTLWKGRRMQDAGLDLHQIQSLLREAIRLDPSFAEAHLQLGNLYSDQKQYADAISEYVIAVKYSPDLGDLHYRLGQAYVRTGDKDRAQKEFELYQRLRAEHLAEADKQKADIRQFVYTARDSPAPKQ
ncbi:MAG: tetratricopeptide repeat protein [Terriglobales bacterium]